MDHWGNRLLYHTLQTLLGTHIDFCKSYCAIISNTFLFQFSKKMLFIRDRIHKMLVWIPNRKVPNQTAQKTSALGLSCFSRPFWQGSSVQNFRRSTNMQRNWEQIQFHWYKLSFLWVVHEISFMSAKAIKHACKLTYNYSQKSQNLEISHIN